MFRMYGRKVEVLKYQISYIENGKQRIDYAVTEEEANEIAQRIGGVVAEIASEDDAWMDGIEVEDSSDTYGEAMNIYKLGEKKWKEKKQYPTEIERISALESAILSIITGGISNV